MTTVATPDANTGIREHFDRNAVTVAGEVGKIWAVEDSVFARLRLSGQGPDANDPDDEPENQEDDQTCYVTVHFQDGCVDGKPITLQPGDIIQVDGFLTHNWIRESIRKFLDSAKRSDFLETVPPEDLNAWRNISFRRSSAVLNALSMNMLHDLDQTSQLNAVTLEGIAVSTWQYSRGEDVDTFLRMAIYDEHTRILDMEGNFGRKRRSAHYMSARFANGQVAGHSMQVSPKSRLRISGKLQNTYSPVTLHEALIRTGSTEVVELMSRLPGAENLHEIKTRWSFLHVNVSAAVIYTIGRQRRR